MKQFSKNNNKINKYEKRKIEIKIKQVTKIYFTLKKVRHINVGLSGARKKRG